MKLYLSSFLLGNDPAPLIRMAGNNARCALILNALDNAPEAREQFRSSQTTVMSKLGFSVKELDLRSYFTSKDQLASDLRAFDMLWVNGGNAFILRKAMRQSGLDMLLPTLLAQKRIVYAGFSAAAVIASSDLRGLTPSAASYEALSGYNDGLIWEGLQIISAAIVVHYDSDHPGRDQAADEARYYQQNNIPHRLLRDGEALVIDGSSEFVAGWPDRVS
ncbi:Type 1 glutamine amidotransferase-like domain-containing protein [Sphingobium sp. HBC34]|uniref:Type 1 glutamine amidotransferase-like domain-containing protein n=1 Tax=Sphingobium cyanobacteriorum TaxID=3063954 RepID=A0ABT8ZQ24_9SPHN|nr:Type 1 glutamine amidotransferase-like domain-containing protein [Sphingobium sp. HBC34]MDO7836639.1 Type 1 glutamine amidotransferase-like domain-containing protein [Sphingobium sp. HBC34]